MTNRQLYLCKQECDKLVARLAIPGAKCRAVQQVTRIFLLHAPYYCKGRHIDPVAKSLGAGVYEISNAEDR